MRKIIQIFSDQKKIIICVAIIILTVLSVLTRTIDNEKKMQWFDDSGRDTVVAELIVKNGEYADIRPGAGFLPALNNSTLYYNFLAGLNWLSKGNNKLFFDLYGALSGVITVISIFFIGYLIYGFKLAIPASLTVLIHPLIVFINVSIYQRYLLASITPIFILFTLLSYKKRRLVNLAILNVIYIFIFCLHYGAITLSPVFLWINYIVLKEQEKSTVLSFVAVFTFIFLCVFFSTAGVTVDEIHINNEEASIPFSFLFPLYQVFLFFKSLFNCEFKYLTVFVSLIISVLFFAKKKNDLEIVFYGILATYFIFQLGIGYGARLLNLNSINLGYEYFYHYIALFAMLPYVVMINVSTNKKYRKLFDKLLIVVFFIFIFTLVTHNKSQASVDKKKDFYRTRNVADQITSYNNTYLNDKNPLVVDYTSWGPPPGWFAPSINYHIYNKIDVCYSLRKDGNNLRYKVGEIDKFFLVCRNWNENGSFSSYSRDPDTIATNCVNSLFSKYFTDIKPNDVGFKTIFVEDRQSDDRFVVLFVDLNGKILSNNFLLDPWPASY